MRKKQKLRIVLGLMTAMIIAATAFTVSGVAENDNSIPLYSVSSSNSSVFYGAHESVPDAVGIAVSLSEGDKFTYNKPINLKGIVPANQLLEICLTPRTIGTADFGMLKIRLTDAYDPTNYLTVQVRDSKDYPLMFYALAAAYNQVLSAMEYGTRLHVNNSYGQWAHGSFTGLLPAMMTTNAQNCIYLAYDYAEKAMSFNRYAPTMTFSDFDSADYYSTPWKGFTTGEVFLSITADSYYSAAADFVIKTIYNEDLTVKSYEDTKKPEIEIDYSMFDGKIPNAVVNRPFKVFEAKAIDNFDGILDVKAKVFRNYYMTNKASITLTDGVFTPKIQDMYYIEYTAIDTFGNINKKIVEVNATEQAAAITIGFDNGANTAYVGTTVRLPEIVANGGEGLLEFTEKVSKDGKDYKIENGSFIPFEEGTYVYSVTAVDYVGQTKTETYSITVSAGNKPVFFDMLNLPKYFIKGKSYNLPTHNGYDYSDLSGKTVATKVYEITAEGKQEITGNYVPTEVGAITLEYEANNGKDTATQQYSATVVDVADGNNGIDMSSYFVGDNINKTLSSDNIELKVNGTEDAYVDYIMPVAMFSSYMEFSVKSEDNNFKCLNIYFRAYEDDSKVVKYTYENIGEGKAIFYANGNRTRNVNLKFKFDGNGNQFTIDGKNGFVIPDSYTGKHFDLNTYVDGTEYGEDLYSKIGYVRFEITGVKGSAAVILKNLNNQIFCSDNADFMQPLVYYETQQVGDMALNYVYTIKPTLVMDMLDPKVESYMTVKAPTGEIMKSVDGISLNKVSVEETFDIKFSEYGSYTISYYAVDENGNENKRSGLIINVVDEVAPVLTVNGTIVDRIQKGSVIAIPSATATDNNDESPEVFIYVIAKDNTIYDIEGDGFKPADVGKYQVRYVAIDEAKNITLKQYTVIVTE